MQQEADDEVNNAKKQQLEHEQLEREVYLATLQKWGPTLYLGPFIPSIFAVVMICAVAIVSQVDVRNDQGSLCNSGILNTYLLATQYLAYVFLFGYGCMFIGQPYDILGSGIKIDCSCKSLRSVAWFYFFIFIGGLGVNGFGAFAVLTSWNCGSPTETPYSYRVAQVQLIFFWLCAFVALLYGGLYWWRVRQAKVALRKALQAEEEARWAKEEEERLRDDEKGVMESDENNAWEQEDEIDRDKFYGSDSDDEK